MEVISAEELAAANAASPASTGTSSATVATKRRGRKPGTKNKPKPNTGTTSVTTAPSTTTGRGRPANRNSGNGVGSKIAKYAKDMFSTQGKMRDFAVAFAGGYSYAKFTDFVLKNLANGDKNSWIFKYRALLLAAIGIYGNKFIPANISQSPMFLAALHSLVGAAAADFAEEQRLNFSIETSKTETAKESKSHGLLSDYSSKSQLSTVSGIDEYDIAINTGFMPLSIADKLAKAYIKSSFEGNQKSKAMLSGIDPSDIKPEHTQVYRALVNAVDSKLAGESAFKSILDS